MEDAITFQTSTPSHIPFPVPIVTLNGLMDVTEQGPETTSTSRPPVRRPLVRTPEATHRPRFVVQEPPTSEGASS
jgi:hypothetical protein